VRELILFIFSNRNYCPHLFDAWSWAALIVESLYNVPGLVLLIGLRLEREDEEDYVVRQTASEDQRRNTRQLEIKATRAHPAKTNPTSQENV
jgi:hypothetical protein